MFLHTHNNFAFTFNIEWGWGNGLVLVQEVTRCERFISFNLFYSLTIFINLKFNLIFILPYRELRKRFKGNWRAYLHLYEQQ